MPKHVALESDGKISGVKWSAEHLITNLIPNLDNTHDLGSESIVWLNCYAKYLHILSSAKARTLFLKFPNGKAYTPGDTDFHTIPETTTRIANNYLEPKYIRLMSYVDANETGMTTIRLNSTETGLIVGMAWDTIGPSLKTTDWAVYTDVNDRTVYLSYKTSSATETLTIYNVGVEFRFG